MRLPESPVIADAAWRSALTLLQVVRQRVLSRRAVPFLLALATCLVFAPSIWNDFVDWDDQINLKNNPNFRGLGWPQLRWMFTATLMGHYIPVTWLTFGLDYLLWGMDPRGYHLTNVVLHAANAALFYLLALRLLGGVLAEERRVLTVCAAVAALFFAVHPLRAESVAWATERRDVLSGFFTLMTVLLYLNAAGAQGRRRIGLLAGASGTYLLALGSKSIVMTLPLVLLLLDFYPLRRLPGSYRRWADADLRGVWREKIPFFALAGLGAIVAWYAVAVNNFFTPSEKYPLIARIGLVFYSLAFYVRKTIVPVGLSPLYELPYRVELLASPFLPSIAAVLVGGVTLVALRRRWPAGLAAAAYYAIAIAPVSGLLHAGHQLAHDRYSYLSCLGIALLVGAFPAVVVRLRRQGLVQPALARMAGVGIALWLVGLAVMTAHQVRVWRDTDTLWRYAVEAEDQCALCHYNLGHGLLLTGRPALAVPQFERALQRRPDRVVMNVGLGIAYAQTGDPARALVHYERVLKAKPWDVNVLGHRALALADMRRLDEALESLRLAVLLDGRNPVALGNLGNALARLGRAAEAVGHLQRAIDLAPDVPHPRISLGSALLALGRYDEAREQYDAVMSMETPTARSLARTLGAQLILEW